MSIKEMIPEKVKVTCTDNGKTVEAFLDRYVENKHMDIILNTVRLRLIKDGSVYVGNMVGMEFTCKGPEMITFKQGR